MLEETHDEWEYVSLTDYYIHHIPDAPKERKKKIHCFG